MFPKKFGKGFGLTAAAMLAIIILLPGCDRDDGQVGLDPKNPVTISVWHYYNGAIMSAFESMLKNFNETVGQQQGIIVESYNWGSVSELERAVMSSVNKDVGSQEMPNVFASYADTAYAAEQLGVLADLGEYFSPEEQQAYLTSYIEEGKIGLNGELRIFPVAKSTEIMMINDTDWQPFAEACGLTYADLTTYEDVTRVAAQYYHWVDAKTPDIPNDGRAFFGRDSLANFFIIGAKEFGQEIFEVQNGQAVLHVDSQVMRKIWDNHYVPYISGYFTAYGRYRSDDAKIGEIMAYVGSTSSTNYFPTEVTADGLTYPVQAQVLPMLHFADAAHVLVQQGAGMVVAKSTPQEEYASVVFLKWFTDVVNNTMFSALSGYMPVKTAAVDYGSFTEILTDHGQPLNPITAETLQISFAEIKTSELYTNKAFRGGAAARAILDSNLQEKAAADREAVKALLAEGLGLEEAVARFNNDEQFNLWFEAFSAALQEAAQ